MRNDRPCWFLFLFWFGLFAFVLLSFLFVSVFGVCFLNHIVIMTDVAAALIR